MRKEKKPIQGNELFKRIIKAAGIEEEKYHLDYILADNYHANIDITYPEFDLETVIKWGGSEGIYCDVYIRGAYDEETVTTKYDRLHIGTIKSLVESDAQMIKMYHMAGRIYLLGTKYIGSILDDLTWLGYEIKYYKEDGTVSEWSYETFKKERVLDIIRRDSERGSKLASVIDLSNRKDITEQIKKELLKEAV